MNQRNTDSIEQQQNQRKKYSLSIPWKGQAQESIWFIIFTVIILLSGRKRIRLFGCKPVLLADVEWGTLGPSLDSQEAFTSMAEALVPFWGGWRPIDSPGPALEESPEDGGDGGH